LAKFVSFYGISGVAFATKEVITTLTVMETG
jgi:hypothetical protein